jgi:hypothetical protein
MGRDILGEQEDETICLIQKNFVNSSFIIRE